MTERVHAHGALAGVELWFGGHRNQNAYSRLPTLGIQSIPNGVGGPWQTRAMDKTDIADLRRWHRNAALRAKEAGFDIVYVYATHTYLLEQFLNPRMNTRTDEYGGNLKNRVRLIRELLEETRDAVGDTCAAACRIKVDDTIGSDGLPEPGEQREIFQHLAELPDLWDINIADYSLEMGGSRFVKEGALEPYMDWVKAATSKPVVTVGRFTSPDTMASQIRRGIVDMIGAARPSIADPFLPKKIEEGRLEDIRECIGCNVCYAGDSTGVPIRCTQNPTMGEEWRRGWHPERIAPANRASKVLVVGGGPAGLEAARSLGARGYAVTLAEAGRELGGRVLRESRLPGMGEYIRVRDYRVQQLHQLPNVEIFLESALTADDVTGFEADHVVLATGAGWRPDRFDGEAYRPISEPGSEPAIFTPDSIMDGRLPEGPTVIFEQNGYYMGSVIAELLRGAGIAVTYVTDDDSAGAWTVNTGEGERNRRRLVSLGVEIVTGHAVTRFDGTTAVLECAYGGPERAVPANALIPVTGRAPRDDLYHELSGQDPLPFTLTRIGDCEAPGIIAQAVYSGHRYARELEAPVDRDQPLRHERTALTERDPGPRYREILTLYYEEEVIGQAYFDAMAERMDNPDRAQKMKLLAAVERCAANHMRPLLARHGLIPRTRGDLTFLGRSEAESDSDDWSTLIAQMLSDFPGYVTDFLRLEAMAPVADRPALERLTAHETAAIEFLEREASGHPDSTAALTDYISASR